MDTNGETVPCRNERLLREQLMAVPDVYERMNLLVARAGRAGGLTEAERSDRLLVAGCVSRVWLDAREEGGRWQFASDSDAPMVKAVAWALCQIYSGASGEEIARHEPALLEDSGVLASLTQSRRQGARSITEQIRGVVR